MPGKYGLFIANNSPSSCLEWLHLNVTVVLKSLLFGGDGGTAGLCAGRVKPECSDLAPV